MFELNAKRAFSKNKESFWESFSTLNLKVEQIFQNGSPLK